MKNNITGKALLKLIGLVIMSFWGFINCISLFKIGKKINSKFLMIISVGSACASISGIVAIGVIETGSPALDVIIPIFCAALLLPTILTLANIGRYKNACIIEDLVSKWQIDIGAIDSNLGQTTNDIRWATPTLLKVANLMYPGKGNALIAEIGKRVEKKQIEDAEFAEAARRKQEQLIAEEKERNKEEMRLEELRLREQLEREKRLSEERRLEEIRIQEQIEKEKRLAEERKLEGIRLQEQLEQEREVLNTKLAKAEKRHAADIAALQADATRRVDEEKQAYAERERLLQEEKRSLEQREAALQEEISRLSQQKENAAEHNTVENPEPKPRFCINCGKELITGKQFCVYCGTKN